MNDLLHSKIEYLSSELYDLMRIIERGYSVIHGIEREDLKNIYIQELLPFTHDFEEVKDELIEALEEYFATEKEQKLPLNLSYHKLYRRINSEFSKKK